VTGNRYSVVPINPCAYTGIKTRDAWRAKRTEKLDKDALRAKNDPKFRRRFLSALRKEHAKLVNVPVSTLKEITAAADSYNSRASSVEKIRGRCTTAGLKWVPNTLQYVTNGVPSQAVKVRVTEEWARKAGAPLNMRGYDARIIPTLRSSYGIHTEGETEWKHGQPVGYTRATHDNYVRSFAIINGRELHYAIHTKELHLTAPEGCTWRVDSLGFAMVAPDGFEYHPTWSDIWSRDVEEHMVRYINIAREQRRAVAETLPNGAEDCRVTLEDSRKAGNCVEGTLRFCQLRLGMARDEIIAGAHLISVSAKKLIATGEPRALAAVRMAWMRETTVSI
jgi:hypothetical protein